MYIYHIVSKKDWSEAEERGAYHPESLDKEGFIHFSKTDQLITVANNFYKHQKDLIILRVFKDKVESDLKIEAPIEAPQSGLLFPHLYRDLKISEVDKCFEFPCNEAGEFKLPDDLLG